MAEVLKIRNEATGEVYELGGSEEWELINTVTVEEGTEEATSFYFDKDSNGNAFSLKHALLFYYYPKYTGESTIPSFCFADINGYTSGPNSPLMYTSGFLMPNKSNSYAGWVGVEILKEGIKRKEYEGHTNAGGGLDGVCNLVNHERKWYGNRGSHTDVHRIGFAAGLVYAGCIFELWGVRK